MNLTLFDFVTGAALLLSIIGLIQCAYLAFRNSVAFILSALNIVDAFKYPGDPIAERRMRTRNRKIESLSRFRWAWREE